MPQAPLGWERGGQLQPVLAPGAGPLERAVDLEPAVALLLLERAPAVALPLLERAKVGNRAPAAAPLAQRSKTGQELQIK